MAAPLQHICPRCKGRVTVLLRAGEVCPQCRSSAAWERYAAEPLVIDSGALAEWSARRMREERREKRRRTLALAPALGTAPLAALAGYELHGLLGTRGFQPLEPYIEALWADARATLAAGTLALAVGVWALFLLRRSALYRAHWLHVLALTGWIVGLPALLVGIWSTSNLAGNDWRYGSMPLIGDAAPEGEPVPLIRQASAVIVAPQKRSSVSGIAIGSGAVIHRLANTCWIVTCSHVAMPYAATASFRDADTALPLWVYLADGREARGRVVWAAQPPLDVALVAVELADGPQPVSVAADTAELGPSARVLTVPNPLRAGWRTLHGRVLQRENHLTTAGEYSLLYTDLHVQPGDSGSGLFDALGRLVGLNTWASSGAQGPMGISLPSETMRVLLARLEEPGFMEERDR